MYTSPAAEVPWCIALYSSPFRGKGVLGELIRGLVIEEISGFSYAKVGWCQAANCYGRILLQCTGPMLIICSISEPLICFEPSTSSASASKHAFAPFPPATILPSNRALYIPVFSSSWYAVYDCILRSANPNRRQYTLGNHLRRRLSQFPETSRLSCQANYRQGIGECRYHLAFSAATREGPGGRSFRRLGLARRSSGGKTAEDSV